MNGLVLVSYGGITFHGSGANNFNGELLVAQVSCSGSGVTLSYDTNSAVQGDPGLIQQTAPDNPIDRMMTHNQ